MHISVGWLLQPQQVDHALLVHAQPGNSRLTTAILVLIACQPNTTPTCHISVGMACWGNIRLTCILVQPQQPTNTNMHVNLILLGLY